MKVRFMFVIRIFAVSVFKQTRNFCGHKYVALPVTFVFHPTQKKAHKVVQFKFISFMFEAAVMKHQPVGEKMWPILNVVMNYFVINM